MARYIKPKLKLYRRENVDLFLKKKTPNIKFSEKNLDIDYDNHSNYYYQLREKQKLKIIYGVLDKQFYNYYLKSKKIGGDIVKNLLLFLESRLDNVVYKMGFSSTRAEARQIINHKCIYINNLIVNIPSKPVKLGEVIKLKKKCQKQNRILNSLEKYKSIDLPSWVFINFNKFIGYIKRYPLDNEFSVNVNNNLILSSYFK